MFLKRKQTKSIMIAVIGLLIIGNIYFLLEVNSLRLALARAEADAASVHKNENVVGFIRLFISKVLNAKTEVDFETRLELENAVRNLKDAEITATWQKFIGSETNESAAENTKSLLNILISKAD